MKQGTSPDFRRGRQHDVPAAARLAMHSFPRLGLDLPAWESWLTDSARGGVETLWVGEEAGSVVAACRLYRMEQWIAGIRLPVMGLGLVTISASCRRRGLGSELVATGLREARERGDLATALFPFRTSFYQKLGYGMAGQALQYIVPPAAFPRHPECASVQLASSPADLAAIADVYARWAPGQTGQMHRSARAWDLIWQEGKHHGALFRGADGTATGYAVFRYLPEPVRDGNAVQIEEIGWLTEDARRALHGWMATLGDQWDQIVYPAHPDEGFAEHLLELRRPAREVPRWNGWFPECTVMSGPMFRLLDVPRAWEARPTLHDGAATLALELKDNHLVENSGEWTIRFEGGATTVSRGRATSADATLRTDIATLSRIYIGAIPPSRAVALGVAGSDDARAIRRIDDLLRLPRPWTFERF